MDSLQLFCINLDQSTQRWNRMQRVYEKHQFNVY